MNIEFDHDFQKKLLLQHFKEGSVLSSRKDVLSWRNLWMQELKKWHTPYKCLLDCSHLHIDINHDPNRAEEISSEVKRMIAFFSGLFLQKIAGFGVKYLPDHLNLPLELFANEEEARKFLGIREGTSRLGGDDFRSLIQITNHFKEQVVEVSFAEEVALDAEEKFRIFRDKLMNNLTQWHSGWNLLIDCSHLNIPENQAGSWEKLAKFLHGFFLQKIVGFTPKASSYPFDVARSRHLALLKIKDKDQAAYLSGDAAHCRSKKYNIV